ncbi:MAG: Uma2 family endonuclease [Cyanobacteria bacterium J06614_10]
MDIAKLVHDPVVYPESDGEPMSESDATRDYLIYAVEVLRLYFQSRRQIYVSGNLFIYYEQGNHRAVVSPDVFVIFGVRARQRKSYKTWQENDKVPSFILEITSGSTKSKDEIEKPKLYASLGIQEYFQYDPTADYLEPQLKGRTLVNSQYQPLTLQQSKEGIAFLHSQVLGLDLQLKPVQETLGIVPLPKALRFYDPQTGLCLLTRREVEQQWILTQEERDAAQEERDAAQQKAQRLAERLRELGIDPDEVS